MTTVPYVQWNNATLNDLRPFSRLYRFEGEFGYVAHIGNNRDWAVYKGSADWALDAIADHGTKIPEREARELFPICVEARLNYRR
ncbi:hypothetical protein A6S26_05335 [Nostoc sp. ATCC 43529]|nr:hypothetical protein A6S26_05335 [Nostoc sp. ATCC 43529]